MSISTILPLATLAACTVLVAGPAAADPVRQCSTPYVLGPASFSPVTRSVDAAGNNDGWVCRKIWQAGANEGIANVIDNHVSLHAQVRP